MVDFIVSNDPQQVPPPYEFPAMRMNAFAIDLPYDFQRDFCRKFLAVSPDLRYLPVIPAGYVCVVEYPRMFNPNYRTDGYLEQTEVFLTFPALRFTRVIGNFFIPVGIDWAFPFISVNNATSSISGREVLGFNKLLGDIDVTPGYPGKPGEAPVPVNALVRLPTFRRYTALSKQRLWPILRVRGGAALTGDAAHGETLAQRFPWSLLDQMDKRASMASIPAGVEQTPGRLRAINLKQFLNGEDPTQAVFQGLVGCSFTYRNIRDAVVCGPGSYRVFANASMLQDPITREWILPKGWQARICGSIHFTSDLRLDNVQNIYTAPQNPAPPDSPCVELIRDWERLLRDAARIFSCGIV
jgi:hypothetical protein